MTASAFTDFVNPSAESRRQHGVGLLAPITPADLDEVVSLVAEVVDLSTG